ncbi:flagellar basal body rod protein FlgB [Clostridium sp.]|uniref:flagellar basal body rod protein FlgB n=1 Tax=Clostridium sp. TaxID=1506 RepID=UPI002FC83AAF
MANEIGSISKSTYNLIKKSMDVTVTSNKVIANNIANVNTKGYKRYYVPFDEILKNNIGEAPIKTTREKHITNSSQDVSIKRDNSTSMREDGNNVDIESEMTSQAANTMMYESLVRLVSGKLNATSSVIKGGGK